MGMSGTVWRKASRSNDTGGACVAMARLPEGTGLRDSIDPDGPRLTLSRAALANLLESVRERRT
ncbi:DUF397 domain-containing protein [Actinomadura macrotermitis]|uniref:DUF397 domain-containing protein n=1 Tax=Actinomadura macrotermitis TaxID=2585200 RepID=A0A7K0BN63_9ACTN|nr:DUF397 domain-containing protein [Actinomadura macrotermitis]MQY02628.1 hypothetical protein [Actinomadura macrotermitis]